MRPLLFEVNAVTFKTEWIDRETSERAERFGNELVSLHHQSASHLYNLRKSITNYMAYQATSAFPKSSIMLPAIRDPHPTGVQTDYHRHFEHHFRDLQNWRIWRQAPSTQRNFVKSLLLLKKPRRKWWDFWSPDQLLGQTDSRPDFTSQVEQIPDPWIIPGEGLVVFLEELNSTWSGVKTKTTGIRSRWASHIKHYFSAAALAIQFFGSIDRDLLSRIRHIIVDEAHASVAYPQCHVLGLIPILQKNPRLSIERRVDIWNTVTTGRHGEDHVSRFAYCTDEKLEKLAKDTEDAEDDEDDEDKAVITRDRISVSFSQWFEEAAALSSAGIPSDRFSLIFHQSPNTEAVLPIFETVVRDAAWQSALERALVVTPPKNPMSLPGTICWFSESFARVVRDIQQRKGFVHFDI
ncbi:hypothetical protein Ptr902_03444 [Pyrenophora tritici-repentis]|nr:hypothetical protein Ptr902_03444 [Pyrenophora tritici-repentis]